MLRVKPLVAALAKMIDREHVPPRPKTPPTLVWEQSEPARRPVPGPLSRERIVRAAIAIADKHGLTEVSLRKVAAKLKAGPMRIYGYTATKEGLLELMADAVYGEIAAGGPFSGDVRAVLRSVAQRTRAAAMVHPWFVDMFGGHRPHLGPNALAHWEASLAALGSDPAFADIDNALYAVAIVNDYVVGALRSELRALLAEREHGMTESEWQDSTWPYLQRMIATGRYPNVEKVVRDATHPPPEVVFERGLDCVIEGIVAHFGRGSTPRKRRS